MSRPGVITIGQARHSCHTCGKRCYSSRKDARRAIRNIHPSERNQMSAYPSCDGLGFHIGHGYASRRAG